MVILHWHSETGKQIIQISKEFKNLFQNYYNITLYASKITAVQTP